MSRKYREWKASIKYYHTEGMIHRIESSLASYKSYKRRAQKCLKEYTKYKRKIGLSCSVTAAGIIEKKRRKSEKIRENWRKI